jgi:hypothetical protein
MHYIIYTLFLISTITHASEVIKVTQADYSFDTVIRVSVQAKIVEASDDALIEQASPYLQSLRYIAGKKLILDQRFTTFDELYDFMNDQLCQEKHEITLRPTREGGSKGTESFVAKLRPSAIRVAGIHVSNKGKFFDKQIVCKTQ